MSFKTETLIITDALANLRLDKALSHHPEISSRTRAKELIDRGFVLAKGQPVKASQTTKPGEVYDLQIPLAQPTELRPLARELEILFEDDDVIVLNKPAGLVMHPAAGHDDDTLVNALLHFTDKLSMGFNEMRPGIVHRLDRDTSGILVVARNDRAHQNLSEQFKDRKTHRIYWAVTIGEPKKHSGRVESFLTRHPTDRKKYCSSNAGKWAATNYQVLETSAKGLSVVQLKLETGRTHQIRVHLTDLGCPVAGDAVYGERANKKLPQPLREILERAHRFALHATELGFHHPSSGEWLQFKVTWPDDLKELIQFCGFKTC